MRFLRLLRLTAIVCFLTIGVTQSAACRCGGGGYGKNALEVAKLSGQGAAVIFEGTLEHAELNWDILRARNGDVIPTENPGAQPGEWPGMLLTFRVQRAYKGELGDQVQIETGLGGGDCGSVFLPGITYLIYASGPSLNLLRVSMCSPGAWIGSYRVETDLRYLRKERSIAQDLIDLKRSDEKGYTAQEERRNLKNAEYERKYATATGKVCGILVAQNAKTAHSGTISFLSTLGYSPIEHPTAVVESDGSFCSGPLGPGKYYLYFIASTGKSYAGPTSSVYYPGVQERINAMAIEVSAGGTQANVAFKVPSQETHSVKGIIFTNDPANLDGNEFTVALVSLEGASNPFWYEKRVKFEGHFPFTNAKYFDFENVLPGRYVVYVSVLGGGWYTRKTEVNVTTHMKIVALPLVHVK